jgi:hypothetical protein
MKRKRELYHGLNNPSNAVLSLFILFGLTFSTVLIAGCTFDTSGLAPNECCPTVLAFHSSYDWICPASCPGGGLTQIDYLIEFRDGHKEVCEPSDLKITVRNVTDNIDLPSHVFLSEKGVYQGTEYFRLSKDTEFELNATTKNCTAHAQKILTINVVEEGDFLTVVRNGKLTYPDMEFIDIPINAGPGVKVEKIENVNPFWIVVAKGTNPGELIFTGQNGTMYRDQEAAGYWSIGLTKEEDFSIYNNQMPDPNLTINMYLKCTCNS